MARPTWAMARRFVLTIPLSISPKRFHIGHLSTTMIGHSLRRIYDFLGYKTVGINHLGDWGTQFG